MACHRTGASRAVNGSTMSTPQEPCPSPAAWFLEDDGYAAAASSGDHFLDECRMCGTYLPRNRDIYMYKGDAPFCSEDCRDQQIRFDEHEERASRRRRAKAAAASASPSVSAKIKSRVDALAVGAE